MRTLIAAAVFVASVSVAFSHGPASWIMTNPHFQSDVLNPDVGGHCCGPADCEPWPESDVEPGPDGYLIRSTGETIPYERTFYTDADQVRVSPYWRCRFMSSPAAKDRNGKTPDIGDTRCFFAPGGAS